ncbi:MAG TPA: 2-oxoglutarate and iron-dependent oxygenase domain-containing protein, partial [Gammaproteobacteria bacterium]|nr:2-oxoglutarate and iron-dependent oxygenase domain-containing protein [Gammaproteobacteria bacterium]
MSRLPAIDLGPFLRDPLSTAGRATAEALCEACHAPGFCYVAGHGVAPQLDTRLLDAANRFFALPATEREALAIGNSPHFRGYTLLGDERTRDISDWREQLDVGPEEPAPVLGPDDPPWLNLRGPNQWPASLPQLRAATLAWMAAMEPLGVAVMRALALGLGLPIDTFDDAMLPRGDTHVKIIRYPAQQPDRDTGQGVGLHHDSGVLTFILQDTTGGLEVHTPDGILPAGNVPGTYVMNLGEMLQAATNGYLRATPHRVASPAPGKARLSVAFFAHPRLEARFEPVALPPALASRARGAQNPDPDDPVFSTFGENCLKIRLRAHPD